MRRYLVAVSAVVLLTVSTAHATQFTFEPVPNNLANLDHNYYYGWLIDNAMSQMLGAELRSGVSILGATLTFTNIWDWIVEPNDILSVVLLAEPPLAPVGSVQGPGGLIWAKYDGQSRVPVPWGANTPVGSWTDPVGGVARNFDLVFNFTAPQLAALAAFAADGDFGFGFDPDCHYYNSGIKFVVTTGLVPEPAMLLLLGVGLVGMGLLRRKIRA